MLPPSYELCEKGYIRYFTISPLIIAFGAHSRVWESLSAVTCCRSLVAVYDGICILQIGVAAESPNEGEALAVDAAKLMQGSLYQAVMKSGART